MVRQVQNAANVCCIENADPADAEDDGPAALAVAGDEQIGGRGGDAFEFLEQIPAKLNDFAGKDLLQHINLARVLLGEMIPSLRDAR